MQTRWKLTIGMVVAGCLYPGGDALPHGGGMDRFGDAAHEEPGAKATGPLEPYEDPFDVWPLNLIGRWNETPDKVEAARLALAEEIEAARRAGAPRERLMEMDAGMHRLEVRLAMARKRQERDTMRRDGRTSQAEELDREIHELKSKLAVMEGKESAPQREARQSMPRNHPDD